MSSQPFSFAAQQQPQTATPGLEGLSPSASTGEALTEKTSRPNETPTFGSPSTTGTVFGSGGTFSFGGIASSNSTSLTEKTCQPTGDEPHEEKPTFGSSNTTGTVFGSGSTSTFSFGGFASSGGLPTTFSSLSAPSDPAKSLFGSPIAASGSAVSPEEKPTATVFGSSRGAMTSFASLTSSEKTPLQQPSFVTGYREASDSDDNPSSSSSSDYAESTDEDDEDSAAEVMGSIPTDRDDDRGLPPTNTAVRGSWTLADEAIEAVTQGSTMAQVNVSDEESAKAIAVPEAPTSTGATSIEARVVDKQDESVATLPLSSELGARKETRELASKAEVAAGKKQTTDRTEQSFASTPVVPFNRADAGAAHRSVSGETTVPLHDPPASPPTIVRPLKSPKAAMSPFQLASEILSGQQPRTDSSHPAGSSQKGTEHAEQSFASTPAMPHGRKEAIAGQQNVMARVVTEESQETTTEVDQQPHSSDSAFIKVSNEVQAPRNVSSADEKEKSPHRSRRVRPVETIELPLGVIDEGKLKNFDHDQSMDATTTPDGYGSNEELPGTPGAVSANVSVGTDARLSSIATWESSVCEQVETLRRDIDESSTDILRTKEKLTSFQSHIESQKTASVTGKSSFNRSLQSSPARSSDTSNSSHDVSAEREFPSRARLQNVPSGEEVVSWSAGDPEDHSKKDLSVYTSPVLVEVEKMEPRNNESGTVPFLAQKFDEHHQSHLAKQEKLDASFDSKE